MYALSFLALTTVVNAHLFISSPPPLAGSAPKNPLLPDGSNFPCHGVALPGSGGQKMPAGSSQVLAFDTGAGANTAVHGGGSCQISITYETDPVKIRDPKNWFVIYSVEEGCPTNSPMNLDGVYTGANGQTYTGAYPCSDSNTNGFDCVNQFNFDIPKGMKNGQATLSWTWFNAVGNREMYQNCVAIDITGGASDTSKMQDMPGMFVANLDASDLPNTCRTTEMTNVAFPQPGAVLEIRKASPRIAVASASLSKALVAPTGCPNMARNGAVVQPSIVASKGGNGLAAVAQPSILPNKGVDRPDTAGTIATSAVFPNPDKPVQTLSTAVGTAPAPGTTNSSATGSGACPAGSTPCKTPGALVCPDATHFGICDINNCAVVRSVAAGTQCKNGSIAALKRDVEAVDKRIVRFRRSHRHGHRF